MGMDLEAAGDAVTGGLVAGAVERKPWWRPTRAKATAHESDHHAHGACLDCGTQLIGPHCHVCGQAGHLHSTMGGFAHELLHGVFHFEGKIWRTLPMLAFHPGQLTRRYIDGERTKFVGPMALFLFSVFLLFAVVASLPAIKGAEGMAEGLSTGFGQAREQMATGAANQRRLIARLEQTRAALASTGAPTDAVDRRLAKARTDLKGIESAEAVLPGRGEASPRLTTKVQMGGRPAPADVNSWFQERIEHVRENPKLFLYKMKSAGYKYSWALIPITLPFIWLMFFWKRRFGLYDHAIFATYSLAFMSLLTVVVSPFASYGSGIAVPLSWAALAIIPPIHMYKQLRYGYALGRIGAAVRMMLLLVFVTIAATLFSLLLLYLGAAG
ncbi:DUF3667 domain-containing protein [Sphingomonas jatrophae]|uniref:DUF3667 domain-containing protein n=1 Tax=Sphingomonas jatrophae TaxID=1166337 RepID=A0A1I6KY02_9SPHN|nr:DUF3667 domain-containing protein [Sphingomonas jatrophae]SFR96084.1 Protein of unknown function [Sphingomonas jatrophae]